MKLLKYFLIILSVVSLMTISGCSGDDHAENQVYYCPMHPHVTSDKPGVCPICNMDLVLQVDGKDTGTMDSTLSVMLDQNKSIMANVSTVKVKRGSLNNNIKSFSYMDFADQNRKTISARFNGRIEKLYVDRTGEYVSKGEPLFSIYSPDLIQAQREHLIALNSSSNAAFSDDKLLASSRNRLMLLGLTENQIQQLESTKDVQMNLTYYSPFSGTVIEKQVQEGMYVNEGTVIYNIADMSTLWNITELFEKDISNIKPGTTAKLTLQAYPGETFTGKVDLIYPVVNSQSRTIKVRSVFKNNGKLKPNMYGETSFELKNIEGILIPSEAVQFTGDRNIVWVKVGEGSYQQREVKLGSKFENQYQVLEGLNEGEEVAATGTFLIDSESQLRSGSSNKPVNTSTKNNNESNQTNHNH